MHEKTLRSYNSPFWFYMLETSEKGLEELCWSEISKTQTRKPQHCHVLGPKLKELLHPVAGLLEFTTIYDRPCHN